MDENKALREHLLELLDGRSAHQDLAAAIRGFPMNQINERPPGSPHSAWELLEHIRIAQSDILEFCRDPGHISPDFPEGYWTKRMATALEWQLSAEKVLGDLQAVRDIVSDPATDLFAPFPHGTGQTVLREAMLVADHNSYHIGQMMLLKKIFETHT